MVCVLIIVTPVLKMMYSRTPLFGINWASEPSRCAENPDNWIFL